jgi:hypothetical protein
MKKIKNFSQFLNEGFFDNPVLGKLGSMFTGTNDSSYGNQVTPVSTDIVSTEETPVLRDPLIPAGKSIVIGDSLSPNIAKCSEADLISNTGGTSSLWKGGIAIGTLLSFVKSYGKTDSTVKNVVISIGTNGIFGRSTDTVNKLVDELKKKFPNAKLLVVKGIYGPKATWSAPLTKVSQTTVDNYYSDFTKKGVYVVPTAIGNQTDAHSYTDIYKIIGKEIDANLA